MISEIKNGIADSSLAPITMTIDRNHFVDPTIGVFKESIEVFIKTPTKRNTSLKYFLLGRSISKTFYEIKLSDQVTQDVLKNVTVVK